MRPRFDPFLALLEQHGLPAPVTEFVFAPGRKFRADYCWLEYAEVDYKARQWHIIVARNVIVEKDGGTWQKGGHSSGRGILRDMEKANIANELGFVFLRYTPKQLMQQPALDQIRRCLGL